MKGSLADVKVLAGLPLEGAAAEVVVRCCPPSADPSAKIEVTPADVNNANASASVAQAIPCDLFRSPSQLRSSKQQRVTYSTAASRQR